MVPQFRVSSRCDTALMQVEARPTKDSIVHDQANRMEGVGPQDSHCRDVDRGHPPKSRLCLVTKRRRHRPRFYDALLGTVKRGADARSHPVVTDAIGLPPVSLIFRSANPQQRETPPCPMFTSFRWISRSTSKPSLTGFTTRTTSRPSSKSRG